MLRTILLITLLTVFTGSYVFCGQTIYTWKDADGTINITDKAPSEGVEIIDVSPAAPKPTKSSAVQSQSPREKITNSAVNRESQYQKAAQYRKEEHALRQQAEELNTEALELRSRSAITKVKKKYKRRAKSLEAEAAELIKKADELSKKAAALENPSGKRK